MRCPRCQKGKAINSQYGWTPCKTCQNIEQTYSKPHLGFEFTTDNIRDQRLAYRRDILQPFHNGVLSKEYLEEYGTSGIKVSKNQIKNAKYTYKDTKGWWNRDKSKGGRK